MRILITGTTYSPYFNGQAIFTTSLAEGLAARGHTVCVITPSDGRKPYRCKRNGVHILTTSPLSLSFLHNQAHASLFVDTEVRAYLADCRPHIVHLHDHFPLSNSVLKYARKSGLPVLGTNHFMPENLAHYVPFLPKRLLWWWMKRTFNRLDVATAPSRTAVEILKAQGVKIPIHPISCGVDLERFSPNYAVDKKELHRRYGLDPDRLTFLFVGRVDTEKRLDVAIRALKLLNRRDIQLAVTGSGAALSAYKTLVKELALEDQVRFTGYVPGEDLPLLLNSADVFLMPSEAELLSIASLEAMASGLPLLAARSKALPELVDHGQNGYLFEPGDPGDAARHMTLLADHPERFASMSAASLRMVQAHSVSNILTRYEQIYQSCLDDRPAQNEP